MDSIIHYTSLEAWKGIQEEGALYSRSGPINNIVRPAYPTSGELPENIREITTRYSYLVGIPPTMREAWERSGLLDLLALKDKTEVRLTVPITVDPETAFVREHAHYCPRKFIEEHGEDLFRLCFEKKLPPMDPRLVEAARRYTLSTVSLAEYDGSYSVPEVWLPQVTPLAKLTKVFPVEAHPLIQLKQ